MSWGVELFDQFDNVSLHAHKGINFCDRFASFTKDRIEIENEYAKSLKKLVKTYQPKKKEEDDYGFSWAQAFLTMLKEIHDIAGQHEVIAENLDNNVVKSLLLLTQDLKTERKKCSQEENKHSNSLQHSLQSLEKSKRQYDRAFKDAEKGVEAFKKADADQYLSRADVEKAKSTMHSKMGQCESCKKEYAAELQKTNQSQNNHYNTQMPLVFQQMEDVDRRRIEQISGFIKYSAETERSVIPIVNTCIDGMLTAAQSVNPDEDVRLVITKYKSGYPIPTDFQFEDFGDPGSAGSNGSSQPQHSTPKSVQRSETMKSSGTQSGRTKQRKGLFGAIFSSSKQTEETKDDFSHLPPQQQKKKLQEEIDRVHEKIKSKTGERDGLQKLRDVYVQNNKLGDPKTLNEQLETNAHELDKLQQKLRKYETFLAEAGQNHLDASNNMQRKMSNRSINSNNTGSNPGTPVQLRSQNAHDRVSPDSGVNTNHHQSYNDDDSFEGIEDDDFKVLGSATALYHFDAPNDGSIPMKEGEVFQVIEADLGDGWTRVRNNGGDEGFVPSSYVQVKLQS